MGASHRDSWIITWHQRHVWFWSSIPITGRLISLCRTDETATQTKHPFTSSVGCLHGQPGAYSVSHANVKCILPAYSAAVLAVICELLSQGHKAALWVNWSESVWTQFAVLRGLFFCLCVCEGEQTDVFIHNKCRSLYRPGEHLPEMFPQVSGLTSSHTACICELFPSVNAIKACAWVYVRTEQRICSVTLKTWLWLSIKTFSVF